MVAKISMGSSLYGALAYNGEKINEARGKLLATNKIYNDGTGTVDIGRALNDFLLYMPSQTRVEKPVVHISLNPHPGSTAISFFAAVTAYAGSWRRNTGFVRQNAGASVLKIRCAGWMFLPVMSRGRSATL